MKQSQQAFRDAVRSLAEDVAGEGDHPSPKELIAYARGAGDAVDVQEHLVICRICAELVLDFEAFPRLAPEKEQRISDTEIAARWEVLQRKLSADKPSATDAPAASPRVVSIGTHGHGWAASGARLIYSSIAASLLVATVALGFWVASLRGENERLARERDRLAVDTDQRLAGREQEIAVRGDADAARQLAEARRELEESRQEAARRERRYEAEIAELRRPPQNATAINVPVFELYPEETLRGAGGGGEARIIELPRAADSVTFTLNSASREASALYRLRVIDSAGRVVWAGGGLRKNASGGFAVRLPRRLFADGEYRFHLSDAGGAPLEEYRLAVFLR